MTGDRAYAREVARANGTSLRERGVTMVMAPVADVDPTGVSETGSRGYSTDVRAAAPDWAALEHMADRLDGYLRTRGREGAAGGR